MNDREKLKKLVDIFGELIKIEGNEWLVDELFKTIGQHTSVEEIAQHSVIQSINEYCIEKVIEHQAKSFYHSFRFSDIKEQLIADYKKMEHERRRNDFENFTLSLYQQLENIINLLFDLVVSPSWEDNKNEIAYTFPDQKTLSRNDLILGKSKEWYAQGKFKAVLFYIYYDQQIKVLIPFNERVSTFDEIYQVRNKNHRGNKPSEYQKNILSKIEGKESKYYFKFFGFLQDFTMKTEDFLLAEKNNYLLKIK
jgi:hypothetical protein